MALGATLKLRLDKTGVDQGLAAVGTQATRVQGRFKDFGSKANAVLVKMTPHLGAAAKAVGNFGLEIAKQSELLGPLAEKIEKMGERIQKAATQAFDRAGKGMDLGGAESAADAVPVASALVVGGATEVGAGVKNGAHQAAMGEIITKAWKAQGDMTATLMKDMMKILITPGGAARVATGQIELPDAGRVALEAIQKQGELSEKTNALLTEIRNDLKDPPEAASR